MQTKETMSLVNRCYLYHHLILKLLRKDRWMLLEN